MEKGLPLERQENQVQEDCGQREYLAKLLHMNVSL